MLDLKLLSSVKLDDLKLKKERDFYKMSASSQSESIRHRANNVKNRLL